MQNFCADYGKYMGLKDKHKLNEIGKEICNCEKDENKLYETVDEYDSFQDWKEIGRGGFGTIYSAYSEDAEKIVALKSIHHDSSSANVNEFIKEVLIIYNT
ncbi:11504_t:CDS:2 [Dentiscutata heterogama]|uniref:11504_t:CDS:1 n=1 Tax=Dentiscutata heterogama TaxID=1316150 RepID=A0ACA9KBE0_9GLOM|nr:11504_t:CDS:2 [Dentiscutata heterogama]